MAKKRTMTLEKFLKEFNGAPYDREELARIARNVEGEVGDAAILWLAADDAFTKSLKAAGYEEG